MLSLPNQSFFKNKNEKIWKMEFLLYESIRDAIFSNQKYANKIIGSNHLFGYPYVRADSKGEETKPENLVFFQYDFTGKNFLGKVLEVIFYYRKEQISFLLNMKNL